MRKNGNVRISSKLSRLLQTKSSILIKYCEEKNIPYKDIKPTEE